MPRRASHFLALVLRHRPAAAGIELDRHGWVAIDALLAGCAAAGRPLTRAQLLDLVARDDKQRYAISDDGLRIRASQGHSIDVDLELEPADPPEVLYQGTVERFVDAIRREGLRRMQRHHVHLSEQRATAEAVGRRRGEPVVLVVQAGRMARDGHRFYRSANGVWLTDAVPAEYLEFPGSDLGESG